MTIYTSEKVAPYVYMGVHKETGEFYIGSRTGSRQKLPSHQDIYKYRTSSKRVKPIFDEFDWVIIAEFLDSDAAYNFEQEMIYNEWSNNKLINGVCHYNKSKWSRTGLQNTPESIAKGLKTRAGYTHSPEARAKMSASAKGKHISEEAKRKMSEAKLGTKRPHTDETKQKMSDAKKGKPRAPLSDETKRKLSGIRKGRVVSEETRQKIAVTRRLTEERKKAAK